MSRPIFTEEAANEAAAAAHWHEAERKGRGEKFTLALEAALDHIEHQPESFAQLELRFRRIVMRRFPYAVFFRVEGSQIVVHAVFHTSQNPHQLLGRLRDA